MEDTTLCFWIAFFILFYMCVKIVFQYLRENRLSAQSAESIVELYKKEAEFKRQRQIAFNFAGLLFGIGIGLLTGILIKTYCLVEKLDYFSTASGFMVTGNVIMWAGLGMLVGCILNRKLNHKE